MNDREKIREAFIDAKIYDTELPKKAVDALSGDIPKFEPGERPALDILFNKNVYQQEEFYLYELTQEHKGPAPKTEQEKANQIIYDILAEQLDKVISALKEIGLEFGYASIIGEDLDDDLVHLIMYRQKDPVVGPGKRPSETKVRSIVPDRPYVVKRAAKVLGRIVLEQIYKERAAELAKKNHTPNWVSTGELFKAVADALHEETETDVTAEKLIGRAYMASDWPLNMRTRRREDKGGQIAEDTQIDCPEYIVFKLNQGGSWELKKADGLKEAQTDIKQGFRSRQTKAVVVLNGLKKLPYTLFAETDEGLIEVDSNGEEASMHKILHVRWG